MRGSIIKKFIAIILSVVLLTQNTISFANEVTDGGISIADEIAVEQEKDTQNKTEEKTDSELAQDNEVNELTEENTDEDISKSTRAGSSTNESDFTYEELNGSFATITGYNGTEKDIVVPKSIGEYTIQEISANAFKENKDITSIVIPDSCKKIGENAFENCKELINVDLGSGVLELSNSAFFGCEKLKDISCSTNLQKIGEKAFDGCKALQ